MAMKALIGKDLISMASSADGDERFTGSSERFTDTQ